MNKKEREKLKEVLRAIKIPRHCDVSTANISFNSEYFGEMVLNPLEKLAEWEEADEKAVIQKAKEIKKETPNGEFRKRFDHIKEVLKEKKSWITGGSIAAAVVTGLAFMARRRNTKGKTKTEKQ